MRASSRLAIRPVRRSRPLIATILAAACVVAGCASSSGSSGGKLGAASITTSGCGSVPGTPPPDPDGALAQLPDTVKAAYSGTQDPVLASAWANSKPKKGPWKIGYTALAIVGPTAQAYKTELEKDFNQAKAKGLVTGSLQEQLMPDPNAPTPAQQIQTYQSLVRSGMDGIILQPFSPPAMTQSVQAAGRAGIPTVSMSPIDSKYAITVQGPFYAQAGQTAAAVLHQLKGKGDVLIVRGIPGVAPDTEGYRAYQAVLKQCPGVKVVGQVTAQFSDTSAKSAVQTFLSAHPGKIDAVLQVGAMASGTLNAFRSAGRPVPLITANGATAGFYTYWNQHGSTFSTAGVVNSPAEIADGLWNTMMRTLAGNGPKVSVIDTQTTLVTNDNLAKFVTPGASVDATNLEQPVPSLPYLSASYLNQFFNKPGDPN